VASMAGPKRGCKLASGQGALCTVPRGMHLKQCISGIVEHKGLMGPCQYSAAWGAGNSAGVWFVLCKACSVCVLSSLMPTHSWHHMYHEAAISTTPSMSCAVAAPHLNQVVHTDTFPVFIDADNTILGPSGLAMSPAKPCMQTICPAL